MGTNVVHEPSYSIRQFCEAERISEPTYFQLRGKGLGPEELRFPGMNIVRITHAARLAWQERMANLTGEHAEALARTTARLRAKAHDAAAKAVASDKHISKVRIARRAKAKEVA